MPGMLGGYFLYFLMVSPALLLMMWAQYKVKSAFQNGMKVPARLTGAATARHILDTNGLQDVGLEMTRGVLSDHYDPGAKVIRLSQQVYDGNSASSVGIAAHEAGHALQDAKGYAPLVIRNAAVPAAKYGPTASIILLILGGLLQMQPLIWLGILAFGGIVFFQLINLPVEFDASNRAKVILTEMQIVDDHGAIAVRRVLNAAAWTYVAGTLQSILTLLYYVMMYTSNRR